LTTLNLTKLDVLSGLDMIPLGIAYRLNGKVLDSVPADIPALEELEVVYEELPGWKCDISKVVHPTASQKPPPTNPEPPETFRLCLAGASLDIEYSRSRKDFCA
jgi:Adenylosuccinate synthetase